ncbi:glycosyltransferase family 39 protein [Nostoc sp. FACHB-152]|nr:glycosyltransferase family 39 protein [Nostoc sp. FACHB-152]MBD2467049.1 glycosyltransferase family 39 protein [Nostoc sp. FACHB-145]
MRNFKLAPSWLRLLIVVVLVVGVFFRFFNLDGKIYWHDETFTSLRISGYTAGEVKQRILTNSVITKESLAHYQGLNQEKGLNDTIKSLAIEDPQHPPVYYVLARFWVGIFGNSVTAIRSLSALISLLVFPCTYWLCRELFPAPSGITNVAIALMAISPIQLVYAQEAREYILWVVTILLSSASLLRALRLDAKSQNNLSIRIGNWVIYSVTLALSLYTFLLSGFVAVAHSIYVIATAKFSVNKTVKAYLLASLAGFLAFMPWIAVLIDNFGQFDKSTSWTKLQLPLEALIKSWLLQLSRIFLDLNFGFENPISYLITLIFLTLVVYAIYFLCRTAKSQVWLFIVTLTVLPALPLMLPDLIVGGIRSLSERYLLPSYLGIQLAVNYLIAQQLCNRSLLRRRIGQFIMMVLIICGLVSYCVSSQAETWWSKVISDGNPQVAKIINQAENPLLISDDVGINYGNVFSLSYVLQPKVKYLLLSEQNFPNIPNGFSDIFLLSPSEKWRKEIEVQYKSITNVVYSDNHYQLWKVDIVGDR